MNKNFLKHLTMRNKHTYALLITDSFLNDQLFNAVTDLDVTRVEEAIKNGGDAKFYFASTGESLLQVAVSAASISNDIEKTKNVIKICELLVKHGANLEKQCSIQHKGWARRCTPLFSCVDHLCSSHQALFCELTKTLLHLGADVNTMNEEASMFLRITFSAIHLASRECNEAILKILIEESGGKAQIDLPAQLEGENKEHTTCTPLQFVCSSASLDAPQAALLLLKYGADVNKPFKNICGSEDTPLHTAIRLTNPYLVQILLAFGADPQIPQIVEGRKIDTAELFRLHFTWLPLAMLKFSTCIQWSPDFHKSLAPEVKSQMLTLLLCFQRLRIPLTCWKHPAVECIFKAVLRNFILGKLPPEIVE